MAALLASVDHRQANAPSGVALLYAEPLKLGAQATAARGGGAHLPPLGLGACGGSEPVNLT